MVETFFKIAEGLFLQFGAVLYGEAAKKVLLGKPAWEKDFLFTRSFPNGDVVAKLYQRGLQSPCGLVFRRLPMMEGVDHYEINILRNTVMKAACSRRDDEDHGINVVWGFGRPDPRGGGRPATHQDLSGIREDREPGNQYVRRWVDPDGTIKSEPAIWRGFTPIYIGVRGGRARCYEVSTSWLVDFVEVRCLSVSMEEAPKALQRWLS